MSVAFKKPDLNGPRFRSKRVNVLNNELFKQFKEKFPEHDDISLQLFKSIVLGYNRELVQGIKNHRDGIELPEGLGYIFMGTCPRPSTQDGKKNIDFAKSVELGVAVAHQNWDSDNKLMKIFYTNHQAKYKISNKEIWAFKLSKPNRKELSDHYKGNYAKYPVIESDQKISAMFEAHRRKHYAGEHTPESYNEFKDI